MQAFTNIVGNDALRHRLAMDVLSGSLSHAYIIEGREGSGRRTLALNLAAALSCTERGGERFPCLECTACRKILDGKTPDIIRIAPERDRVGIGVEAVRFIRTDAMTVPNDFDYKVYIIENADAMTPQAQNALLLTLEEPHSYAVFLLICQSASAMLETVRSRAPIIRTEPIRDSLLRDYLIERDPRARSLATSEDEFAAMLSEADGRIGRALTLLDPKQRQPGQARRALAERFAGTFCALSSARTRLELANSFSTKRDAVTEELAVISLALRDLILLKKSDNAPLCFWRDRDEALELAWRYTLTGLLALYDKVSAAADALSKNANLRLTLTALLEC